MVSLVLLLPKNTSINLIFYAVYTIYKSIALRIPQYFLLYLVIQSVSVIDTFFIYKWV